MAEKILEFTSDIEFIANINLEKDCLMNQGTHQENAKTDEGNPMGLWFNIDIPKGHGLKNGDRIKIIIEKVD
ncbi:MAG: hypothetical protein JW931_04120 [Methanomicrobiaceae archaeon]|nr:hypothetical protein [Methanomicrobiaceae archaeon]